MANTELIMAFDRLKRTLNDRNKAEQNKAEWLKMAQTSSLKRQIKGQMAKGRTE